jgi:hypothetical protein
MCHNATQTSMSSQIAIPFKLELLHMHCKQIIKQKTLLVTKGMTEMILGKKKDFFSAAALCKST